MSNYYISNNGQIVHEDYDHIIKFIGVIKGDRPCLLVDFHNVLDIENDVDEPNFKIGKLIEMGYFPIVMSWVGAKGGPDNKQIVGFREALSKGLFDDFINDNKMAFVIWQCSIKNCNSNMKQHMANTFNCRAQIDDKAHHLFNPTNGNIVLVGYYENKNTDIYKLKENFDAHTKAVERGKVSQINMKDNDLKLFKYDLFKLINSWDQFCELCFNLI